MVERAFATAGSECVVRIHIRPVSYILFLCFFLVVWALLLSSFLIGLIKNVELGLKILGFGGAAVVGIGGALPLFVFFVVIGVRKWFRVVLEA
jgi:hypothetical protein